MNDDLQKNYIQATANWRTTLRQNNVRTQIVIILFFLIYFSIGMLVDLYLAAGTHPDATIPQLFHALITLQIFPIATLVMVTIAAISLFVSYAFYDRLMLLGTEYRQITPETAKDNKEVQLYNVVEEMKIAANLNFMPRVFIIEADYMNAFATGYSEKSAMVAITRGLMEKLNRSEMQAVMAHELSHVKHMDIKITLTATLLSNLSIMVLDFLFYQVLFGGSREGRSRNSLATIILILRYLLPVISLILMLYLSRKRELMADAGCVQLMRDNEPLASALIKINQDHQANREAYAQQYQQTPHENTRQTAYLYDPSEAGISTSMASFNSIFSTHPDLKTRLAAIGYIWKGN